jgi:hypothetical protein
MKSYKQFTEALHGYTDDDYTKSDLDNLPKVSTLSPEAHQLRFQKAKKARNKIMNDPSKDYSDDKDFDVQQAHMDYHDKHHFSKTGKHLDKEQF